MASNLVSAFHWCKLKNSHGVAFVNTGGIRGDAKESYCPRLSITQDETTDHCILIIQGAGGGASITKNYYRDYSANYTANKGGLLSPKDTAAIDAKLDDGLPQAGKVLSLGGGISGTGCMSATAPYAYLPASDGFLCSLYVEIGTSL